MQRTLRRACDGTLDPPVLAGFFGGKAASQVQR
jgi:hypothetical protein